MKVQKLREVFGKIAGMQHRQGDAATGKALERLSEIIKTRDKDDVSKMVDGIQQRRGARRGL